MKSRKKPDADSEQTDAAMEPTTAFALILSLAFSLAGFVASIPGYAGPDARADVALFAVRFVHFALTSTVVLYPVLFGADSELDAAYLAIGATVFASWFVFGNECVLSSAEKRLMDGAYRHGDDPYRHAYLEPVLGRERSVQRVVFVLMIVAFGWTAVRFLARCRAPTALKIGAIGGVGALCAWSLARILA